MNRQELHELNRLEQDLTEAENALRILKGRNPEVVNCGETAKLPKRLRDLILPYVEAEVAIMANSFKQVKVVK